MSESVLPVSLSEISRNSTNATDSIGTMTIRTKNTRSRARKLIELHYVPVLGAIAQLGERLDRTQEVGGSSPPSSIPETPAVEPRKACRHGDGASAADHTSASPQLARRSGRPSQLGDHPAEVVGLGLGEAARHNERLHGGLRVGDPLGLLCRLSRVGDLRQ